MGIQEPRADAAKYARTNPIRERVGSPLLDKQTSHRTNEQGGPCDKDTNHNQKHVNPFGFTLPGLVFCTHAGYASPSKVYKVKRLRCSGGSFFTLAFTALWTCSGKKYQMAL